MKNLETLVRFMVVLGIIVFVHSLGQTWKNGATPVRNKAVEEIVINNER